LLHEGSGSAAVNAFVELVFDNSDQRFNIDGDEVVLRRTVGSKKDEFFLQRKRASKQEVQSLLEGAGFSKSNPYFMVQQGKIQSLCVMTDAQRLELLQQVAGTTLYEDKKAESLIKMEENQQSLEKISKTLQDMDEELSQLEKDKEELTAYQLLDRERKALEYTLYDKELRKARLTLDSIENDRVIHLEQQTEVHDQKRKAEDDCANAEAIQKLKLNTLRHKQKTRQHIEEDKSKMLKMKTVLELKVKELEEESAMFQENMNRNEAELKELEKQITKTQSNFEKTNAKLKEEQEKLLKLQMEKDQAIRKADALYSKQGRGKQYSSKEERDAFLRQNIQELEAQQEEKRNVLMQQQDSLGNVRRKIESLKQSIDQKNDEAEAKKQNLHELLKKIDEIKKKQLELMDVRKNNWREAVETEEKLQSAREARQQTREDFFRSMPRNTALGIRALNEIVDQEGVVRGEQYFGMVMENFVLKDRKYQTAVEKAAENSLFHVIVDSDATAARLMERLEAEKRGRVTFMPLNQLRVDDNIRYPSTDVANREGITPLIHHCIEFMPAVKRAMQQVFDRKLLARTPEIAAEKAKEFRMDCVTLDGDFFSRKGALSGGYVNPQKSRIRAFETQQKADADYQTINSNHRVLLAKWNQSEQDVNKISDEYIRLENKQKQMSQMVQSLEAERAQMELQIAQCKRQAERIESQIIPPLERQMKANTEEIAAWEEEIGTELSDSLSDDEKTALATLRNTQEGLESKIIEQKDTVDAVQSERNRLLSMLEDNFYKRRQELNQIGNDEDGDVVSGATSAAIVKEQKLREIDVRKAELRDATRDANELEQKLSKIRSEEEVLKEELVAAKGEVDRLKSLEMKLENELARLKNQAEKYMGKKAMIIGKRDGYSRKIQELGSLPPDSELRNFRNKTIEDLERGLDRVNTKLKKYSHVNKKALDQFVNISEKREALQARKDELDRGARKVKELVDSLDRKKDEAINRTFRGVSKNFAEVFKELVPLGEGELIMRTAIDEGLAQDRIDNDDSSEDGDMEGSQPKKSKKNNLSNPDVSLYRGVGVRVRFSTVGENFIMSQLSGGQKALVALALIFAIQRCDPAPFYIFDELDQALDSSYRQAVANLIKRQANSPDNPTQFITSTFRPELVEIAKNCYGIALQNKVSTLNYITKNDALKFIANLMQEEEAVGEVTTNRSRRSANTRKRKSTGDDAGAADGHDDEYNDERLETQPMIEAA
jgi:structural maintenance of chromosome 3 (chondroitin sulfate proteoglycan 6)